MEIKRRKFEGVWNIVRFNWHFYILALMLLLLLFFLSFFIDPRAKLYLLVLGLLIFVPTFISLSVSYYVYDLSGLYKLNWITDFIGTERQVIVNISAGFDETSKLLKNKFHTSELFVFDFYNPQKHTEISIKRARKVYTTFPNTKTVTTTNLPLADNFADIIFIIFAAHEIRSEQERIEFFRELNRIISPMGQIVITEHLRDIPNFFAYNIGFFHFYRKQSWLQVFELAGFTLKGEQKITPFISTFTIVKDGVAP